MSRGSYVWRGFCPRGFCPEGVLSAHRFKVMGSRSAPQLKHLPSWRVWEGVLMNKGYQVQKAIVAQDRAMYYAK